MRTEIGTARAVTGSGPMATAFVRYRRPKGLPDDSHVMLNTYECPCGAAWEDAWDCGCDDECPSCGADVSPSVSIDDPECDCEWCRDRIVRRSSRGWGLDAEGWWTRPFYRRDLRLLNLPPHVLAAFARMPADQVSKRVAIAAWVIGTGNHAFVGANGWLYCRNARQKRRLDNGGTV